MIDAHQHIWQLSRNEYTWLTPALKPLYRDFLPADLLAQIKPCGITQSILVQAAPSTNETTFLLDHAARHDFIAGVVGWVDLLQLDASETLAELAENALFLGVRPMLQDEANDEWILQPQLAPSIQCLSDLDLTFDALVFPRHLPHLIKFIARYPQLKVVIDHCAKPMIKQKLLEPWASQMAELARFPNVYCKLSGILTEAESPWHADALKPYMETVFDCFGVDRIIWGSDFPVLQLASSYRDWFLLCQEYVKMAYSDPAALDKVFGSNAEKFYQLV